VDRAGGDWESVSFEVIMEAVEGEDPRATAALDDALRFLAVGIANLSREFRPSMIILGGYLFERGESIYKRLRHILQRRPALFGLEPSQVVLGELGGKAVAIGAGTLILENFFGVARQIIDPLAASPLLEPAFERTPVWPDLADQGTVLAPSTTRIAWAGNLTPDFARVRVGEPITVALDVKVDHPREPNDLKALLHWDRVAMYGGHWATPKNSPMQLSSVVDGMLRYEVTLGALPPGRYEFTAHVMGANDVWLRAGGAGHENNGRVEVLPSRGAMPEDRKNGHLENNTRKEAARQKQEIAS
jgi:hypothetical protein